MLAIDSLNDVVYLVKLTLNNCLASSESFGGDLRTESTSF